MPVDRLRALPDGANARLGALAEPLANGVHAARVGRAGVEGGPVERALVIGAGTIGLMTLQAWAQGGTAWTGVVEPDDDRRAAAAALGATQVFADADELPEVDVAFDAVGLPITRRQAIERLRPEGCAVLIGLAADATPLNSTP